MKKPAKPRLSKAQRQSRRALKWAGTAVVLGLIVYAVSRSSGIAYDDAAMGGVVDFSVLDQGQKLSALREANRARCACGCGMGLAQCVATDRTCPIRDDHIDRIREMVRKAMNAG